MGKKIVIYFEQYSWGGTDTHLKNLLIGWPNRSDQFVILVNHENVGIERIRKGIEGLGNVSIRKFPSLSREGFILKFTNPRLKRVASLFSFPFFWGFWLGQLIQAFQLLKDEEPVDILISNNGGYPGGWGCNFAVLAAVLANINKRILLIHHQATGYRRLLGPLESFLDNLFFKFSSNVVAVSEATKSTILDIRNFPPGQSIDVIFNGINIEPSLTENVDNLKDKFDSRNKKIVGIMGVIERYKGHEYLIRALNEMDDRELAQLKFLIIGKGAEEEVSYLKSLMNREAVSEAVCFTGYVEGDSQSIIEQLDLMLVLTVDFEGFGLTLAEAMSVEVPVLATRVGAIPEFIFHEKNGFLINPRNKDELIVGLRNFLSNQKEWKERAKLAKNSIQEFSIERLGREFCQLVNNL